MWSHFFIYDSLLLRSAWVNIFALNFSNSEKMHSRLTGYIVLKSISNWKQRNEKQVEVFCWIYTIKCTTLLPPFFLKIWGFILKKWLPIYDSKYCPSLATTFFYLFGNFRIPSRKKKLVPRNAEHNLGTVNIRSGRRCGCMSRDYPWFFELGIIVVDPFYVVDVL